MEVPAAFSSLVSSPTKGRFSDDRFLSNSENKLDQIMAPLRGAFIWSVFFSLCVNLLLLTVPLYLLQVFDRVLGSRSVDTLYALTLIAVVALVAYGLLEASRRLILSRVGLLLESKLSILA